jgi:hypothetical protein
MWLFDRLYCLGGMEFAHAASAIGSISEAAPNQRNNLRRSSEWLLSSRWDRAELAMAKGHPFQLRSMVTGVPEPLPDSFWWQSDDEASAHPLRLHETNDTIEVGGALRKRAIQRRPVDRTYTFRVYITVS